MGFIDIHTHIFPISIWLNLHIKLCICKRRGAVGCVRHYVSIYLDIIYNVCGVCAHMEKYMALRIDVYACIYNPTIYLEIYKKVVVCVSIHVCVCII